MDEVGVPAVSAGHAATLVELDRGVNTDRVDVDGPVVTTGLEENVLYLVLSLFS